MRASLMGDVTAFLSFNRVPKILDNFYTNRQLFIKIVNSLSIKCGSEFYALFYGKGNVGVKIQKHRNVYNEILRVDKVVSSLSGSDQDMVASCVEASIIAERDRGMLIRLLGGE